jgi:predicted PurR-regulated permease PerM
LNQDKKSHLDISITSEALFRGLFIILGLVILYLIRDVLVILLLSVIIAAAVSPAAGWFQKKGFPRTLAVFIIYLLAFAVLVSILYFILAPLSNELDDLSLVFPIYFDKIQSAFQDLRAAAPQYEQFLISIQNQLGEMAHLSGNIFGATSQLFGGVVSAVFVIVISFYLSAQEHGISLFIRSVTPKEHQSYVLGLWARAQHKLGRWFQVQLISSALVGGLVFIGLSIFGIKHSVPE